MNAVKTFIIIVALAVLVAGITIPLWWYDAGSIFYSSGFPSDEYIKLVIDAKIHNKTIAPYIDISKEPLQTSYTGDPMTRTHENAEFRFMPVAKYKLAAMSVGVKVYNKTDFSPSDSNYYFAMVSPVDLCLIWGKNGDPHISGDPPYDQLTYKLQDRSCGPYKEGQLFYPVFLNEHLSNNLIIPADDNIREEIIRIKDKEKVILSGFLVDVNGIITFPDNQKVTVTWRTSQTRTDAGTGASEIFYVTNVTSGDQTR